MEWLVARAATRDLQRGAHAGALSAREMSDLMADFFTALAGREVAIGWAHRTLDDGGSAEVAVHNALRVLRRLSIEIPAGARLAGHDLRGEDFSGRILRGADLTGADLTGARLLGADLVGASLRRAKLARADLSRANLARANLAGADLSFARLLGADLRGATLQGAWLRHASLVGAKLDAGALDGLEVFGAAPAVPAHVETVMENIHRHVEAMAFSPDGVLLASSHQGGSVWLWDRASGKPLRVLDSRFSHSSFLLAFSFDGHTLASASRFGTVALWDVATGNMLCVIDPSPGTIRSIAWSPDGLVIALTFADTTVELRTAASGGVRRSFGCDSVAIGIAFSPDSRTLASVSEDMRVRLWDVATGDQLRVLESDAGCARVVTFSHDGRTLASACSDGTLVL